MTFLFGPPLDFIRQQSNSNSMANATAGGTFWPLLEPVIQLTQHTQRLQPT